ncbi:enolase C-terminal domain-like protein [Halolamina litorea]|uniref:mandelate racemase/muconate lactonizing enzyme family protein n=1 Tax=Halolamina litorea TaxID=1515593 RepID=UPI002270586E|nr:enolase C-terminal domain-like protein [Halolamina litorea]
MSPTVRPFALDLSTPLSTADGEITERRGFLVGVDDPARGLGEATPLPGWTESFDACEAALRNPPAAWDRVDDALGDGRPATPAARHGYRLAVLDAAARDEERPLSAHLADRGGFEAPADTVPVNATVGDGSVEDTVAAAQRAAEAGFDTAKLKVGARSLSTDIDRVRAVLDAVDLAVRVDANGAWDRETASEAVEAFASFGVEYVEQPLPAGALSGLAALRGRGVGIAADESLGEHGVGALLDADAADVAVLKPMALGGPDAAIDAARRLLDTGVDPVVTTTIDGAVARAAAVHVAAAVPDVRACGLSTGDMLVTDLGPDPSPTVDGAVRVPEGPGNVGSSFDGCLRD